MVTEKGITCTDVFQCAYFRFVYPVVSVIYASMVTR